MNDLFITPKAQTLIARLVRSKWVIRPLIDHLDHSTWVISTNAFGVKKRSFIVPRPLYAHRPSPNRPLGFWRNTNRSLFGCMSRNERVQLIGAEQQAGQMRDCIIRAHTPIRCHDIVFNQFRQHTPDVHNHFGCFVHKTHTMWRPLGFVKSPNLADQSLGLRLFCLQLEASCLQWSFFTYSWQF